MSSKPSSFGVIFEWFDGDEAVGKIEMDGPQWDGFYRLAVRLPQATCDRLGTEIAAGRVCLDDLSDAPVTKVRAFLSVEQLNEFLASGEPL